MTRNFGHFSCVGTLGAEIWGFGEFQKMGQIEAILDRIEVESRWGRVIDVHRVSEPESTHMARRGANKIIIFAIFKISSYSYLTEYFRW